MTTDQDMGLSWTGERYIPGVLGILEAEHMHRYLLASEYINDKKVLDIASGEGYGTSLLAEHCSYAIGVDISDEAITHANKKYNKDNLEYRQGSASSIPLEDNSVDVVVSFETIEHHDMHEEMMSEISRVLRDDGLLIISSPDKLYYSDIPGNHNPHHVKELYKEEFFNLVRKYFRNVVLSGQRITYGSVIFPETSDNCDHHNYLLSDKDRVHENGINKAIYLLAFASKSELPTQTASVYEMNVKESEEVRHLREHLVARDNIILFMRQSWSWRITRPFRAIRKLLGK